MRANDSASTVRFIAWLLAIGFFSLLLSTCKYPEGPPNGNTPPETRLANIPADDTLAVYIERTGTFPEVQLNWLGDDPDGYVIAFRYRWSDARVGQPFAFPRPWTTLLNVRRQGWENYILIRGTPASLHKIYNFLVTLQSAQDLLLVHSIGDSLATMRPFVVPYKSGIIPTDSICGASRLEVQTPTTGTFIFDSPADSNIHRFEVSSIDNNGDVDPTPATVKFWTLVSPGSVCRFVDFPDSNSLAIRCKTDRWRGLRFSFTNLDPNNSQATFSYAVDDTSNWSPWAEDGVAEISASDFIPVASGPHRFFARTKNRWGVVSPVISRTFYAVIPNFDDPTYPRRTLIINNNRTSGTPSAWNPDSTMVNTFYKELLASIGKDTTRIGQPDSPVDIWMDQRSSGVVFPAPGDLGNYSSILLISEQRIAPIGGGQYVITINRQDVLKAYLNVGGKFIFSSPMNIETAMSDYNTTPANWAYQVHHLLFVNKNFNLDFAGGKGQLGYPSFVLDSAKFPSPDSLRSIRGINANYRRGFAEIFMLWDSRTDNLAFEDQPLGVRFLDQTTPPPPCRPTYSMVFFGFPLYFVEKPMAIELLRHAYIDINE